MNCQFDMTEHESKYDYLGEFGLVWNFDPYSAILAIITRCGIIYGGEHDKGHVCARRLLSRLKRLDQMLSYCKVSKCSSAQFFCYILKGVDGVNPTTDSCMKFYLRPRSLAV